MRALPILLVAASLVLAGCAEREQIGAAIGREFSYRLLAAVARLPEDRLRAALAVADPLDDFVLVDALGLRLVVGRDFGRGWLNWRVIVESALFDSGRPVLVTPEKLGPTIGENVVTVPRLSPHRRPRCGAWRIPTIATASPCTEGGIAAAAASRGAGRGAPRR